MTKNYKYILSTTNRLSVNNIKPSNKKDDINPTK